MFHRIGAAAYKADLSNTHRLMEQLDHPENGFRSIHVAGTNGKGSTSHMLASILECAGYKTGLYTSPHLLDFRERIRINGTMISEEAVTGFVERHRSSFDEIAPSFFEWTVALAFDHFRNEKVDVAVIETGLGGRLDSTNVIHPEVSVITNIGWDHSNLLGDTLQKIAAEKAGIIKWNVPVVIGERDEATEAVFRASADASESSIQFASDEWQVVGVSKINGRQRFDVSARSGKMYAGLELDLAGTYQCKNILTVLAVVDVLRNNGRFITDDQLYAGMRHAALTTGLMGRWQQLADSPITICDVGHNLDGIRQVVAQLTSLAAEHIHFVIGMVKDKDVTAVLKELPGNFTYYFCQPALPRALPVDELQRAANSLGLTGAAYTTVEQAVRAAQLAAGKQQLVFIGGSTFVVAEAMVLFQ